MGEGSLRLLKMGTGRPWKCGRD